MTERVQSNTSPEKVSPFIESFKRKREFREKLLSLAISLINVDSNELSNYIDKILSLCGKAWSLEIVVLAELSNEPQKAFVTNSFAMPGISSIPAKTLIDLPSAVEAAGQREAVVIGKISYGSQSIVSSGNHNVFSTEKMFLSGLLLSLRIPEAASAILFFGSSAIEAWPDDLKEDLSYAGQIVAKMLERKRGFEKLNEIKDILEFERHLSEISATYINVSLKTLEKTLRQDFERLNRILGVDASSLFVAGENPGEFHLARPFVWFLDENQKSNTPLARWMEKTVFLDANNFPYTFERWSKGEAVPWNNTDHFPPGAAYEKQTMLNLGIKSALSVPISFEGSIAGTLNLYTTRDTRVWPGQLTNRLRLFGEIFINALMRKRSEERLQDALCKINELKERIQADYLYLSEEVNLANGFADDVVGNSPILKRILTEVRQVACTEATVLIQGETGTGKGVIARAIHNNSSHRDRPVIQVNCAALAPSLIESELFGHEKGAFTGAIARRLGRFEVAKGTTLFLDEIGDLPLELQPKLLRVLEEGEFERVGGTKSLQTDARVIAATSKNLEKEVEAGRFRKDLWYRLNLFTIFVPPLRDRLDDIPLFVEHFLKKSTSHDGKGFDRLPSNAIKMLQGYAWPGNIRELKNVIERAVITSCDGILKVEVPEVNIEHKRTCSVGESLCEALERFEREEIQKALEDSDWIIEGPKGAAERLGINPSTLRYRAKKLRIKQQA